MGERTRKLIKLALNDCNDYEDESEEEAKEPSIYATDGSDDESYVPSTDEETDDDADSNLILGTVHEPQSQEIGKVPPIITTLVFNEKNITEDKMTMSNTRLDHNTNFTPLVFELQNDLNKNNWITDNDVQRLQECFSEKVASSDLNGVKASSKKMQCGDKQPDVFQSPYLIENKYKKTMCKFCDSEIVSKHFARHLQRKHIQEREVKEIFSCEVKSTDRKKLLALLRNEGNLEPAIRGQIIPKKCQKAQLAREEDYAICVYCKAYYRRLSLSRHMKNCFAKLKVRDETGHERPLAQSLIFSTCHKKYGEILDKLEVKQAIFSKMLADVITSTAINDILILLWGEDLLKKTKNKRSVYHISNKLRECGKFLIEMRRLGSYKDMLSILKPENFDDVIEATKIMSRYDVGTRSFGAASLALHFGTTLKKLSELAVKLILRKKIPLPDVSNVEKCLTDVKRFKEIVESQWTTEIGSLALKDLNEKAAIKPKLLPVTEDIIKLKKFLEQMGDETYQKLTTTKSMKSYRSLVEITLVLTILHNRKRVGDIQYLELSSYSEQINRSSNETAISEMATSLTENEKILTRHYKRIVAIGKGSRAVTILIPKNIQKYFTMVYSLRTTTSWFSNKNTYFFTYPKSLRWIDGCSIIRKYAKLCGATNPELLTSCRLRKHIATVTQVLSLKSNEIDQLAKFMGHTTKTHETFYKLPQDIYQVAKVSKILQLMEKGNVAQFKNKNLEEIDIDMENIDEDLDPDQDDLGDGQGDHEDTAADVAIETCRTVDDDSDSDLNLPTNSKKCSKTTCSEKKRNRQRWKNDQKKIMQQHFKQNIKKKLVLRKKECEEFLEKYKEQFEGVGWVRVKTFIFNEYRLKD